MNLYSFQKDGLDLIKEKINAGTKDILVVSPTGSGKTVMMSKYMQTSGRRTLLCVPRQALVGQWYQALKSLDVDVSVIHNDLKFCYDDRSGEPIYYGKENYKAQVLITMSETWDNKAIPDLKIEELTFDEAHLSTSEGYRKIRSQYGDARLLGLTATPYREQCKPGEELDTWYTPEGVIEVTTIKYLIENGFLLTPKYDNIQGQNLVKFWQNNIQNSANKRTVCFCSNSEEMIKRYDEFRAAGISAEYITAGSDNVKFDNNKSLPMTTPTQRLEIFKAIEDGDIDVIFSVRALAEGWNSPSVNHCILDRFCGPVSLYAQIVGRVIRPYQGDQFAHIYDAAGSVNMHGPVEELKWSLQAATGRSIVNATSMSHSARKSDAYRAKLVICTNSGCMRPYSIQEDNCPFCNSRIPIEFFHTKSSVKIQKKRDIDIKTAEISLRKRVGVEIAKILKLSSLADINKIYEAFESEEIDKLFKYISATSIDEAVVLDDLLTKYRDDILEQIKGKVLGTAA